MGKESPWTNLWDNEFDVFHEVKEASLLDYFEVSFRELRMFVDQQTGGVLVKDFGVLGSGESLTNIQCKSWNCSEGWS